MLVILLGRLWEGWLASAQERVLVAASEIQQEIQWVSSWGTVLETQLVGS
jgi:hypothetical protein